MCQRMGNFQPSHTWSVMVVTGVFAGVAGELGRYPAELSLVLVVT